MCLRESIRRHYLISSKSVTARLQKQRNRGVLRKKYSENLQKTPMPKFDFNKVAKQLYWNHTSAWVFSCKFSAYLRTPVLRTPLMDCFWSLLFLQQIMKENSITDFSICFCFVKYSPCRRLYNISKLFFEKQFHDYSPFSWADLVKLVTHSDAFVFKLNSFKKSLEYFLRFFK